MAYKLFFTYMEKEYPVKFHSCQGCEELTIGDAGWYCGLGGDGCDYPEETIENIKKIEEQKS
jgi:hypothetical protein